MNILKKLVSCVLLISMLLCLTACGRTAKTDNIAPADAAPIGSLQSGMRYLVTTLPKPDGMGSTKAMALDGETLYALDDALSLFSLDINSGDWTGLDIHIDEGYPLSMTVGGGKLYLLLGREASAFEDDSFLVICDAAEKTVQRVDKPPLPEGRASAIFFVEDKLLVSTAYGGAVLYSPEGEYLGSYSSEDYSVSSVAVVDGKPYVTAYSASGSQLCALNAENLEPTPMFTVGEAYASFYSYISSGDLLCATDSGVSTLDPETGFALPLFNWLDIGFTFSFQEPQNMTVTADGEIFLIDPSTGDIYRIKQGDAPDARKELTIAVGAGVGGTFLSRAMAIFNMNNPDYVAKVLTYSQQDADKVPAELATGKGIDVVYMGTSTDMESAFRSIALKSSLFEDLLPYLEADPELSRADFIPGVFDSMLQNGHLYGMVPGFMPYTVIAPKSFSSSVDIWNMDALIKLNNELPEGYGLFDSYSQEYMVQSLMQYACARFMDKDNASCSFDSEEFVQLLKLCAEAKPYDYSSSDGYSLSIGTASLSASRYNEAFNGDFEYIGFPSEGGGLNLLSQSIGPFSILASSENKDAAWQFIRILFLPQLQTNEVCNFGMPVIESCFGKAVERRMSKDADITQADADKYKALAMNSRGFVQGGAVLDMIIEEVNKFLGGGKTAEDAAVSIQSRASIYLSEQFG